MNYPTSLDSFTNPTTNDFLNSPNHVSQHSEINDAVEALEAKLGITASTPTSGKLLRGTGSGSSAWDKDAPSGTIVGTTDTQTLTNKTLTSPTINTAIINNPTLKTDTIAEYTAAAGVTIDGVLLKDSKINGSYITNDTITDNILDYPRWWHEIGRNTLSASADTITVSSLPARTYLQLQIRTINSGQNDLVLTFNGDTAANYAYDASTAANSIAMDAGTPSEPQYIVVEMLNTAAQVKIGTLYGVRQGSGTSSATVPVQRNTFFKWANTTNQVSSITITNNGTGDFASGSEIVVLGHD